MAFESFRKADRPRTSHARRIIFAAAAVLHGALIAVGVIYSYWHVDELTPPTLRVTFISASPPPPPPPPPPPAGGGAKRKVAIKTKPIEVPIVQPKPTELVQPRERPKVKDNGARKHIDEIVEDDEPEGVKGGVKGGQIGGVIGGDVKNGVIGGVKGGTPGGVLGGTGTAPAPVAAKFLPPMMGAAQKLSGDDPPFPSALNHAGIEYVVQAKICVNRDGVVDGVTLLKRADALLDDGVVRTVKSWRFRPLSSNGASVPFCYFGRFEFKSHI